MARRQVSTLFMVFLSLVLVAAGCQSRATPAPVSPPTTPSSGASAPPAPAAVPPSSAPQPVSPPAAAGKPAPTGVVTLATVHLGEEVVDPARGGGAKFVYEVMYDFMLAGTEDGKGFDPNRSIINKWERSADGRTWTFEVRQGVKFHDGSPLTAEDVKFSLERVIAPTARYTRSGPVRQLVEGIDLINAYKLVVRTKPNFSLTYLLSDLSSAEGVVLPKAYLEKNGQDYFTEHPIGSGPYKFAKHTPGEFNFEALPEHWAIGVPKYKTIVFKAVPEESTRIAMLKRNEADVISLSREKSPELKNAGYKIFEQVDATFTWAIMHQQWHDNSPYKDARVREALNIAINRDEIVKFVFQGQARPQSNVISPWSIGYESLPPYPYNPERARQLLKEAGYSNGFTINFNWFPFNTVPEQKQVAEAVAGYWQAVGLKVNMAQMEWGAYAPRWMNREFPDPAAGVGVLDAVGNSGLVMYGLFHSKGERATLKDPKLDAMIEGVVGAIDQPTAEAKIAEAAKYMRDNYLAVPIASIPVNIAANPKIQEWHFGKMGSSFGVKLNVGTR